MQDVEIGLPGCVEGGSRGSHFCRYPCKHCARTFMRERLIIYDCYISHAYAREVRVVSGSEQILISSLPQIH